MLLHLFVAFGVLLSTGNNITVVKFYIDYAKTWISDVPVLYNLLHTGLQTEITPIEASGGFSFHHPIIPHG